MAKRSHTDIAQWAVIPTTMSHPFGIGAKKVAIPCSLLPLKIVLDITYFCCDHLNEDLCHNYGSFLEPFIKSKVGKIL